MGSFISDFFVACVSVVVYGLSWFVFSIAINFGIIILVKIATHLFKINSWYNKDFKYNKYVMAVSGFFGAVALRYYIIDSYKSNYPEVMESIERLKDSM